MQCVILGSQNELTYSFECDAIGSEIVRCIDPEDVVAVPHSIQILSPGNVRLKYGEPQQRREKIVSGLEWQISVTGGFTTQRF